MGFVVGGAALLFGFISLMSFLLASANESWRDLWRTVRGGFWY